MSDMKLYQGDCLEIMPQLPAGSVDMILCDLPYAEVNRTSNGLRNLDKGAADLLTFSLAKALTESLRVCKGSLYLFCGIEQVSEIRRTLRIAGLSTRLGIWEKTNPSPMNGQRVWLSGIECCIFGKKANATFNEHCKNSVWRFPTARSKLHPTMKPLRLMEYLIKASSKEGDTILDFCMGSGTTGVACKNLGRRFIGIEQDEGYFKVACERINATLDAQPCNA
jgi:site-specific DNA-methyltransferase (adenine-specific)